MSNNIICDRIDCPALPMIVELHKWKKIKRILPPLFLFLGALGCIISFIIIVIKLFADDADLFFSILLGGYITIAMCIFAGFDKINRYITDLISKIEFRFYTSHIRGFTSIMIFRDDHNLMQWRYWDAIIVEAVRMPITCLKDSAEYPFITEYTAQHPQSVLYKCVCISDFLKGMENCLYFLLPDEIDRALDFDVGHIRIFQSATRIEAATFTCISVNNKDIFLVTDCAATWTPIFQQVDKSIHQ